MAETKIEWADFTMNPWLGCTKVSPGCNHCYAEAFNKRTGKAKWGPNGTRIKTSENYWRQPLKWNREAEAAGVRKRVFCASLADVFEDWVGDVMHHTGIVLGRSLDDLRAELFALIDQTPWLDWLLLTKRPENIARMWCSHANTDGRPPSQLHRDNVWLGTSISDQATAIKNLDPLLNCRSLCRFTFVSAEPLLGPVDFRKLTGCTRDDDSCKCFPGGIDQVIIGCESNGQGVGSLGEFPDNQSWLFAAEDIVSQCRAAGVAAFVKQIPSNKLVSHDMDYWPARLRVRQFPVPKNGV